MDERIPDRREGNRGSESSESSASTSNTAGTDPIVLGGKQPSSQPRVRRFRRFIKRFIQVIAALVITCILSLSTLLGLLWIEHRSELTLPTPSGHFPVGRLSYDWVDQSRTDSLAPVSGQKRELTAWVWYPAALTPASKPVDYLPAPWRTALGNYQGFVNKTFLVRDFALVHAHSISNARVAPDQQTYPVLIMRPGLGAQITDYTTLAEDLASHGYIVVGVDATYSTGVVVFSDGRVATRTPAGNPSEDVPAEQQDRILNNLITVWSADNRFVLNQLEQINRSDPSGTFTGRLNLQQVGVFGHSFGGATAAQFCHDDTRCKAGIDVDGTPFGSVIQEGLHAPFMFLTSDHGDPNDPVNRSALSNIHSIYNSLTPDARLWLMIRQTGHFNFSDRALLSDIWLARLVGATGSIDPRRALTVATGCIVQFFDKYLKGQPTELPASIGQLYPEIQFEAR